MVNCSLHKRNFISFNYGIVGYELMAQFTPFNSPSSIPFLFFVLVKEKVIDLSWS